MKILAVADAFMKVEFYEECFRQFPEYEPTIIFWGDPERAAMRDPIHGMELNGPDYLEPPAEMYDMIGDFDVLMVHLCPVNSRLLARAKKLKVVLTNRGGLENIDVDAATRLGIPVLNNPAHNANSVAELTIGLMLAETRNIARTHANLVNGVWQEFYANVGQVFELSRRTVGIIGFGNIGRRVAKKLMAFDTKTLVYDEWVSPDDPDLAKYNCEYVPLETLMSTSDIITLHIRDSKRYLHRDMLERMKPTAYFINTARSHLVDNDCLTEMLREGRLMGAAFDVFVHEPLLPEDELPKLGNVTLTNHRGGDTVNCYSDSPAMLLAEAAHLFAGEPVKFFVNKDALAQRG